MLSFEIVVITPLFNHFFFAQVLIETGSSDDEYDVSGRDDINTIS